MDDRIRTGDRLDHNQELYQLSYSHHMRDLQEFCTRKPATPILRQCGDARGLEAVTPLLGEKWRYRRSVSNLASRAKCAPARPRTSERPNRKPSLLGLGDAGSTGGAAAAEGSRPLQSPPMAVGVVAWLGYTGRREGARPLVKGLTTATVVTDPSGAKTFGISRSHLTRRCGARSRRRKVTGSCARSALLQTCRQRAS